MILTELTRYLATKTSLLVGKDLYRGYSPQGATGSRVIVRDAGAAPVETDGTELIRAAVQLFMFAEEYEDRSMIDSCVDAVINQAGIELTSYTMCVTGNRASYNGVDDQGRHLFAANLTVTMKGK